MKRVMHSAIVTVIAAQVLVIGQGNDVTRVMSAIRQSLGGAEKLLSVKTLSAEGTITRPLPDGTSRASRLEFAFELPDKYVKKDTVGIINGGAVLRTSGFNGDALIETTDLPPQFGGGGHIMVRPGSFAGTPGGLITPEQSQQARIAGLQSSKREFTRLALGMFASGSSAYPVEFSYVGQAESPDGKADVLEVRHVDGFVVKMFVDATTHMPLMLSWMDKEPLTMAPMVVNSGGTVTTSGGVTSTQVMRGGGPPMSKEDMDRLIREQQEKVKEAEARRKIVEYRMFYADYKAVDGIKLPMRIQRMIAGQPVDEIGLEKVRVNPKLDAKIFTPSAESK